MASAFDVNVIAENSIERICYRGIEAGFQFKICFAAYRGQHLSTLESFQVKLDGVPVDRKDIRFCINGKEFLVDQLKELSQEYWFIRDRAVIKVLDGKGLKEGQRVEVHYTYRLPYTGYFGNYLVQEGNGQGIYTESKEEQS